MATGHIALAWGGYSTVGAGLGLTTPTLIPGIGDLGLSSPLGARAPLGVPASINGENYCTYWLCGGLPYAIGDNKLNGITQQGTPFYLFPQQVCSNSDTANTFSWAGLAGITLPLLQLDGGDHWYWVVDSAGAVYGWGNNLDGPLGQGNQTNLTSPARVKGIGGTGFLALLAANGGVSGGGNHSMGLLSIGGGVVTCGDDAYGQCGDNQTQTTNTTPVQVLHGAGPASGTFLTSIKQISAGMGHCMALDNVNTSTNNLWGWGLAQFGQTGGGTAIPQGSTPFGQAIPIGVVAPAVGSVTYPWTAVSSGGGGLANGETLAIDSAGQLWGWGCNVNGEMGQGNLTSPQLTPVKITLAAGVTCVQASAGADHCMALGSDGKLYVWGDNSSGELGNPALSNPTSTPTVLTLPFAGTINKIWAGNRTSVIDMTVANMPPYGVPGSWAR